MRVFEILLLASLLPSVAGFFVIPSRRPQWLRHIPSLSVAFIAMHFLTEGYRWQMVPAYVLTATFMSSSVRAFLLDDRRRGAPHSPPPSTRWRAAFRVTGALLLTLMLGVAVLIPAAMPVFELPAPSGTFRVGTTRFSLLDSSRPETFTADPSDKRELLIQAWYPAAASAQSEPERLWGYPREIARRMTHSLGLPRFLFDHFSLVRTHSQRNAALAGAQATYPVLVFSHGYNQGIPPQNTVQMEELASHGYVVFSIGHSYESLALIHADGRTVPVSEERMQRAREELNSSNPLIQKLLASEDAAERAGLLQQISEAGRLLNESVGVWVADTRFVLDELASPTSTKPQHAFAGRLDMTRVGIFGMSFGGTVATDVCLLESRCRAGINLDGLQYGVAASPQSALRVPFMFMMNESAGLMNEPVFGRAQNDAWYLIVTGSTHFNYSDFSLISPVFRRLGLLGPIEGQRMEEIMNAYIRAFFDQHLLGVDSPLLKAGSDDYPEVVFLRHVGPGDE